MIPEETWEIASSSDEDASSLQDRSKQELATVLRRLMASASLIFTVAFSQNEFPSIAIMVQASSNPIGLI